MIETKPEIRSVGEISENIGKTRALNRFGNLQSSSKINRFRGIIMRILHTRQCDYPDFMNELDEFFFNEWIRNGRIDKNPYTILGIVKNDWIRYTKIICELIDKGQIPPQE